MIDIAGEPGAEVTPDQCRLSRKTAAMSAGALFVANARVVAVVGANARPRRVFKKKRR
jgi:ribosomal protein L21